MRKMMCRIGVHSWFRQHDRWGSADVCHYCTAVRNKLGRFGVSARVFTEYAVVCDEHGSQIIRIDKAEDAQWLADEHNRLLAHNSGDPS